MNNTKTTKEFDKWVDENLEVIVESSRDLGCSTEFIDMVRTNSSESNHTINKQIYKNSIESETTTDAITQCVSDGDNFFSHIWNGNTEKAWHASDADEKDILTSTFGVSVRCVS